MLHQVAAEDKPQMLKSAGLRAGQHRCGSAERRGASGLPLCGMRTGGARDGAEPGGTPASHDYILDVLLDALQGRPLRVQPMKIAYFEGCHTSYKRHFRQVELNWPRYRQFLTAWEG